VHQSEQPPDKKRKSENSEPLFTLAHSSEVCDGNPNGLRHSRAGTSRGRFLRSHGSHPYCQFFPIVPNAQVSQPVIAAFRARCGMPSAGFRSNAQILACFDCDLELATIAVVHGLKHRFRFAREELVSQGRTSSTRMFGIGNISKSGFVIWRSPFKFDSNQTCRLFRRSQSRRPPLAPMRAGCGLRSFADQLVTLNAMDGNSAYVRNCLFGKGELKVNWECPDRWLLGAELSRRPTVVGA
jgi:hypothetical protein